MLVINTKEELKRAKNSKVSEFAVEGKLAEDLLKAQKIAKLSKRAVIILASAVGAGAVAAPFTAGTSLGVSAVVSATAASSVGTGTIVACLAIGGVMLAYTIFKEYSFKVERKPDGTIRIVFVSKHHKLR